MTNLDLVKFWQEGAREAWKTVEALVASGRQVHALFFCHLTVEKALKAKFVSVRREPPPPVHDLLWLAKEVKMDSETRNDVLAEITKFNISGRYEDYKLRLHEQATPEYVKKWVNETKKLLDEILTN